jgi:hypothetical protein
MINSSPALLFPKRRGVGLAPSLRKRGGEGVSLNYFHKDFYFLAILATCAITRRALPPQILAISFSE